MGAARRCLANCSWNPRAIHRPVAVEGLDHVEARLLDKPGDVLLGVVLISSERCGQRCPQLTGQPGALGPGEGSEQVTDPIFLAAVPVEVAVEGGTHVAPLLVVG
jgi:hypothetical protein